MPLKYKDVTATAAASRWNTQRLASKSAFLARVITVPDGDTLCVERIDASALLPGIEYLRLAGIDAPEMRGPDRAAAQRSQQALSALVLHQTVTVMPSRIWRDPYHRIICRVHVSSPPCPGLPPLADSDFGELWPTAPIDVGAWLVCHGYAVLLSSRTGISHSYGTQSRGTPPAAPPPNL